MCLSIDRGGGGGGVDTKEEVVFSASDDMTIRAWLVKVLLDIYFLRG